MTNVVAQFERAQRLAAAFSASTRVTGRWGHPLLFDRAAGCRVWDLDGREYHRSLLQPRRDRLLGHGDARVRRGVTPSWTAGARLFLRKPNFITTWRITLSTVPCLERVRFTGSGSRGTMHCLRPGRAFHRPHQLLSSRATSTATTTR